MLCLGNKEISQIYLGGKVSEIYLGDRKIFPSVPKTITLFPPNSYGLKNMNGSLTVTDALITFAYTAGYPGYPNYPAQYVAYFDKIDLTPFKNIHIKYSAARSHWSNGTDAKIAIHNNNTDDPKKPIVFEHLLGLVTDKVDYNKISTYVSWKEKDIDITDITGEKYIALVLGNINDTAAYDIKWSTYLKIESMTLS